MGTANLLLAVLGGGGRNGPLIFDLSPFQPPQTATDEALPDRIDLLLFAGSMSDATGGSRRRTWDSWAEPLRPEEGPLVIEVCTARIEAPHRSPRP